MASGGCGYWSIDSLQDFCESIIESFSDGERLDKYKEKWSWHQKHNVPGGICDMSTLWLYLKEKRKRIVNLCKAEEKLVFDCAITSSDNYSENEYMMTDGIKKVDFIGGNPYFQKRQEPQEITAACTLQFQGESKKYMTTYYTGNTLEKSYVARSIRFGRRMKKKLLNLPK